VIHLPEETLVRPPEEGARLIALRLLDDARAALSRMDDPADVEALHDFRVALRRLRSTLRAYRPWLQRRATEDALDRARRLASRTNRARDAEVQIEWLHERLDGLRPSHRDAVAALVRTLEARKRAAYAGARDGVPEGFAELERSLRATLEVYRVRVHVGGPHTEASFAQVCGRLVARAGRDLRERLAPIGSADDEQRAHAARIAAKRLRYLLEPVSSHVEGGPAALRDLRALQDVLGEFNDLVVLGRTLGWALEQHAVARVRRMIEALRAGDPDELALARRRPAEPGLFAVALLARSRARELFDELKRRWVGEPGAGFFEEIEHVAAALLALGGGRVEIERKFLLRGLPAQASAVAPLEIAQGWLPGVEVRERVRHVRGPEGERWYRTIKLGMGLQRPEFEEQIGRAVFEQLWPLTQGCRVFKRRHRVSAGERVWEIDDFSDRDLVLAEVELPSPDSPCELPDWLAPHVVREVTGDPEYTNLKLAR
jgi:CHAD domain-containing protein/CYTH domain-containing protein